MADDPWAAAGYTPVKPSMRTRQRDASTRLTEENLRDKPQERAARGVSIANGLANLAEAPLQRGRTAVALDVDQATKEARIRKEIAEADNSEYAATINRLKSKYPQLTAEQTLAAARATLMQEGSRAYDKAGGFDPGSPRNLLAGVLGVIPGAGDTMAAFVRDPKSQLAIAGQKQFTEGATRSLTGAGLRGDERTFSESEFFPVAFERDEIRKQKAALRKKYLANTIIAAGPAGAALSAGDGPQVGQVIKGYRYKGGAPDRQESWEKVSP